MGERTISSLLDDCVIAYAKACGIDGPTEGWKNNLKACLEPLVLRLRGESILREAALGARDVVQDDARERLARLEAELARARADSARGKQVEEAARIAYGQLCKVHLSSIERDFVTAAYVTAACGALESVFAFGKLPAFVDAYKSARSATHSADTGGKG